MHLLDNRLALGLVVTVQTRSLLFLKMVYNLYPLDHFYLHKDSEKVISICNLTLSYKMLNAFGSYQDCSF